VAAGEEEVGTARAAEDEEEEVGTARDVEVAAGGRGGRHGSRRIGYGSPGIDHVSPGTGRAPTPHIHRHARRPHQRRILTQHRCFQLPEPGPRIDAQLRGQPGAYGAQDRERVGLAPGAVQRQHQLPLDPLVERVLVGGVP
jgi:hypothetical protein